MRASQARYCTGLIPLGPVEIRVLNDACVHWDCFASWEYRHVFARHRFAARTRGVRSDGSWTCLLSDDSCFVEIGWEVRKVAVVLAETASEYRIPFGQWENWLNEPSQKSSRHVVETTPLARVKATLLDLVPTRQSILEKRPPRFQRDE